MPKTIRILSIDGGGIRGLIPALVLEHLEALTGRRIAEQFDLIAGSSTGGIMALLLTRPDAQGRPMFTASDVVGLYTDHGKDLFFCDAAYQAASKGGWALPKYPSSSVVGTLSAYLGDAQLKDAVTDVLVTAYDLDHRRPFMFDRGRARLGRGNFLMLDAARATSAFPGLFPAAEIQTVDHSSTCHLIDGGVVSANPAVLALARAAALHGRDAPVLMVSLGTGDYEAPLPSAQVAEWGLTDWAPRLADVLFDGVNHGVDGALVEMLHAAAYFRFQVALPAANDGTDDVDPANLAALRQIVQDAIEGKTTPEADRLHQPWPVRLAELKRLLARD